MGGAKEGASRGERNDFLGLQGAVGRRVGVAGGSPPLEGLQGSKGNAKGVHCPSPSTRLGWSWPFKKTSLFSARPLGGESFLKCSLQRLGECFGFPLRLVGGFKNIPAQFPAQDRAPLRPVSNLACEARGWGDRGPRGGRGTRWSRLPCGADRAEGLGAEGSVGS